MLNKHQVLLFSLCLVVALDQGSKWWAGQALMITHNTGISLGLFSVLPALALTLILAGVMGLVWWAYQAEWQSAPFASGLFFGGGVSNVLDRLLFGSVRDWLPIPYFNIYNNLADYAIGLGLVIVIIIALTKRYRTENQVVINSQEVDT